MSKVIRKKVKGEDRVKNIISAKVLGGMAAVMLVVASIIGLNQQTDTAQAASTGSINLVNNWSKLSTATSPSKLATAYGASTPSYVGSGKSLYATYTSTGRHVQSKSNQLVIEVVDADLNAAVVKSTLIILKGGHSSSSTVITNFQANTSVASNSTKEYAIPIIDTDGVAGISGNDLTFACRWIGEGFEDTDGSSGDTILRATADVLLDGTVIDTPTVTLANAVAATAALGGMKSDGNMGLAAAVTDTDALRGAAIGFFNESPKCSAATSSLISLTVSNYGDPDNNVAGRIVVDTPSSIAGTAAFAAGGNEAVGDTAATSNIIAGLIQWKTSRINTTTAKAWSGVVSSSNAINILLTETGRNTGVFNGVVNLFNNENTAMQLGMGDSTCDGGAAVYCFGSYGNSNAEAPCAGDCATGTGQAATSLTSTLAVKDGGTVYSSYVDATDGDGNTAQTRQVTAKVDATIPTVTINSPAHASENQTRTPTFSVTATEAASGLDVSGALLWLQEGSETDNSGEDSGVGGDGEDILVTSALHDAAGDDDGNGADWLVSSIYSTSGDVTVNSAVGDDSTTRAGASVTVNRGTAVDGVSTLTYTYTPSTAIPLGANTPVNHWLDFQAVASDLAGNVGYSDSSSTASAGVLNVYGGHHIKVDQKLPSISSANTGWWWDTSIDSKNKTHKHTSTKANTLVVTFDGNVTDIDATDFQITFDDGTTHTPTEATVQSALPTQVFLTLAASMTSADTPKVALAGSVSDIAGNATSTGSLAGATDTIHPTVTATLSGGTGTGTGSGETAAELTKTTMVLTVTTDEELVSNPKVDIYDLGMAGAGQTGNEYKGACGAVSTCGFGASGIEVDDYNIRTLNISVDPPVDSFTVDRYGAANVPATTATVDATSAADLLDASMTAQGTKSFKYTISAGTPGTDGGKTVVVTAKDKATSANVSIHGSISSSTSYLKYTLDDTVPALAITPAADSTTTQTKPYIVIDYSTGELSKVTINTATLDGVDISGKLSTTDNKKFYYVPADALAAGAHKIVSKATDYAGNASSEATKSFTVAARKDFKMALLAGWNSKSVPSDPVDPAIDSVFSNSGVDMVLTYGEHTWSSATKDATSGKFVGDLATISSGAGYWVHNNNFESQAVALIGPVEPSAGAPPAVVTIPTVAGWNFVGVSDVSRSNTENADGVALMTQHLYFGDLTDTTAGGHDIVYSYNTTNLKFVEVAQGTSVSTGEGLWIYVVPRTDGSILPIVPPSP